MHTRGDSPLLTLSDVEGGYHALLVLHAPWRMWQWQLRRWPRWP